MMKIFGIAAAALSVSASWGEAQELSLGRSDHVCGVHLDEIIVCGGCVGTQVEQYCQSITQSCEKYNSTTNTWVDIAPLPRERYRFTLSVVGDFAYVIGGVALDDSLYDVNVPEIDVYDILDDSWSTLADNMTTAYLATDQTAFVFGTNIVIAGGYRLPDYNSLTETHIFDTTTETFSYNVSHLFHGRGDMCSAVVNGEGFTLGGFNDGDFCNPRNDCEEFDIGSDGVSGVWLEKSTEHDNAVRKGDMTCVAVGDFMYVLGGETKTASCESEPLDTVEVYDPALDDFYNNDDMTLSEPRFRFCGASIGTEIYIIGGQAEISNKTGTPGYPILNLVEKYDVSTGAIFMPALSMFMFVLMQFVL